MQPEDRATHETPDVVIEGLRGVAALMVVAAHYLPQFFGLHSFGYSGVDLFFVLSGFVFGPYLAGRPLPLLPHLVRRLFRLYPLYLAALLLYAGLHLARGGPLPYLPQHLLLLQTWQDMAVASHYNLAFWSLPPELEFYLLLPLLGLWVRGVRSLLVLGAVALLLRLVITGAMPHPRPGEGLWLVLSAHLPGLLVEFVAGALAWQLARRLRGVGQRLGLLALALALWLPAAALYLRALDHQDVVWLWGWRAPHGSTDLVAALAYALAVAALAGTGRRAPAWLVRPALHLGALSYGIYLFHNAMRWTLPDWLGGVSPAWQAGACLAATWCLAWLMHHGLEAPMRAWGRRLAQARMPAVAAVAGR